VIYLKDGSIIAINYTGKTTLKNEVFESTIEKKAIDAGIFNKQQTYEPMVAVVGQGDVLKGLDKALKEMKVGEKKTVLVTAEDGWGERKAGNIVVVPLQQFKKEKMQPFPGLVVEIDGRQGRIQSVSGGRVRVDFNHPLAGKELEYDVKVEKEITAPKEQIEVLYKKYFYMVPAAEKKLVIGKDNIEVTLSPRYSANIGPLKQIFSKIVTKHVKGFSKVRFVEEFKQPETKKEDKTAAKKETAEAKKEKPEAEKEDKKQGKKPAAKK